MRWRTSRAQQNAPDQNQNPVQHRLSNHQKQAGRGGLSDMAGNAWVNNDRGNREASQPGPAQEQHVSVNGFNAQDARNVLRNGLFTLILCLENVLLTCQQVSAQNTRRQSTISLQAKRRAPDPDLRGPQSVRRVLLYHHLLILNPGSKHYGQWQGFLPRTAQAAHSYPAAWFGAGRRLIDVRTGGIHEYLRALLVAFA